MKPRWRPTIWRAALSAVFAAPVLIVALSSSEALAVSSVSEQSCFGQSNVASPSGATGPAAPVAVGSPSLYIVGASALDVGDSGAITITYRCNLFAGGLVPMSGVIAEASASPAGILRIDSPSQVSGTDGVVAISLVGIAPGTASVTVSTDDGGLCSSEWGSSCGTTLQVEVRSVPGLPPAHPRPTLGIVPPENPIHDSPVPSDAVQHCQGSTETLSSFAENLSCATYYLQAINAARVLEHVPAMHLPSNWTHLDADEQLFVLADLERVGRGLPPYVGLSAQLDAVALSAAKLNEDPLLENRNIDAESGTWAGNAPSPVAADFEWVYDDGFGSKNIDCTKPEGLGCWGHRDAILGGNVGLECTDCVMGAGSAVGSDSRWRTSVTEIFVTPSTAGGFALYFTWRANVLPYL